MSERREIARLGAPFLVGVLSSALDGVIDTAMMGRHSSDGLAAVAGGSAIFDVFTTVAVATVVGHQILSARFAGRTDGAGIRTSLRATAGLAAIVVLPLTACCLLFGRALAGLTASGAGPEIAELADGYLRAVAPTLVLAVVFTALTATFNAFKLSRAPMVAGLVIAASNILFDFLLIYGPGPFPRLGATGNGLATSLAWVIGLVVLVALGARDGLWSRLRTTAAAGPADFETSVAKLSLPAMASSGVDYASTAVFFGIVGGLGAGALGGGRIAFHVLVLVYSLSAAFGAAVRILIGRCVGADDPAGAVRVWRAGRSLLLPATIAVAVVLFAARGPLVTVFSADPVVREQLRDALLLVALIIPLAGWNLTNVGVIRALGRTKLDLYGNLVAAVLIQLPVAWLLGTVLGLGVVGAFAGMAAYWIVRGCLLQLWASRSLHELAARDRVEAATNAER